jgi:rod shape-determining protein MreC
MLRLLLSIWNGFKEYIILVILLIVSLLLISASNKPEIKNVRAVAFGGYAVINSLASGALSPFTSSLENQRLRETNAKLMLQVNRLREYGIQNGELKRMMKMKDSTHYPLIACGIISKYLTKGQANFTLNAGSDDNVKVGMPVVNDQGLLGLVIAVSKKYSILRTLRNNECKIAVRNQRNGLDGILEWNGKDLIMKNVPKTFDMQVGDRVVTSDFSTVFPPSVPVGIVAGGNYDKRGIFNNIIITPFVDFIKTQSVFIVSVIPSTEKNNLELNLLKNK